MEFNYLQTCGHIGGAVSSLLIILTHFSSFRFNFENENMAMKDFYGRKAILLVSCLLIVLSDFADRVDSCGGLVGGKGCSKKFGCKRGRCWAGCAGAGWSANLAEWCWTTPSGSIACTEDSDCDACWKCDSVCSVIASG